MDGVHMGRVFGIVCSSHFFFFPFFLFFFFILHIVLYFLYLFTFNLFVFISHVHYARRGLEDEQRSGMVGYFFR